MSENKDVSRLDSLEKRLYQLRDLPEHDFGDELEKIELEANRNWNQGLPDQKKKIDSKVRQKFSKAIPWLIGGLVFLGGLIFLLAYLSSVSVVSIDRVGLSIVAPTLVQSAEEQRMEVTVTNNNRADLKEVTLELVDADTSRRLSVSHPQTIQGQSETKIVLPFTVLGEEDTRKGIEVQLRYTTDKSNAISQKEEVTSVLLGSAPVTFTATPSVVEVESGGDIDFNLEISSNTNASLDNLLVRASYPFNFTLGETVPSQKTLGEWHIASLSPDQLQEISIQGTMAGEDKEKQVFRFEVYRPEDEQILATVAQTVTIIESPLLVSATLNGSSSPVTAITRDGNVQVRIPWEVKSEGRLTNLELRAFVRGDVFDPEAVEVDDGGFYNSRDGFIVWNRSTDSVFADLVSGSQGQVGFSFGLVDNIESLRDLELEVFVQATAQEPVGLSKIREIQKKASAKARVGTNVDLVARYQGENRPRVDESETYTITWMVDSATSDIKEARVAAELPINVTWVGNVSPQAEKVTAAGYSRTVVWDLGTLGDNDNTRSVSFDVTVVPGSSQKGSEIELLQPSTFTGIDVYTGQTVGSVVKSLQTGEVRR